MSTALRRTTFTVEVGLAPEEAFDFFSRVDNLNRLTPDWLRLHPATTPPRLLAAGAIIDYRFSWRLLRMPWRTRITVWQPPDLFTYEQERGPYRFFRHEHRFEARGRDTRVTDIVHHRSVGGALVARWIVEPELRRIFAYRAGVSRSMSPLRPSTPRVLENSVIEAQV